MSIDTSPSISTAFDRDAAYRRALLDWLACATAGRVHPAAGAARAAGSELSDRVVAAGCAGHVLDFDDTYLPGIVHLSAPVAPVALVLGAELDESVGTVIDAYAAGVEAMGALARSSHPGLYDRGFHATSVCGVVGAATAASLLMGLDPDACAVAVRISLLRAGGMRGAFGSQGKSLQVGMAAATGLGAARLAASGARVPVELPTRPAGFEDAYGATWSEPSPEQTAIDENWIKAYPCCLQTHSTIEAAAAAREAGVALDQDTVISVHPVSRQAAPYDEVEDGLQAKFSIPYTAAFSFLRGFPTIADFDRLDDDAVALARRVTVRTDPELLESEARLTTSDGFETSIDAARGSPLHPMDDDQLDAKVRLLAGESLIGALEDLEAPVRKVLEGVGLG